MATELWAIFLVTLATLVGAFGPILLKKASEKKLSKISSLIRNYHLMGGVALFDRRSNRSERLPIQNDLAFCHHGWISGQRRLKGAYPDIPPVVPLGSERHHLVRSRIDSLSNSQRPLFPGSPNREASRLVRPETMAVDPSVTYEPNR